MAKALGTGFSGFGPRDIEVLRDDMGKPYEVLYGEAGRLADSIGVTHIHVSISNLKELVAAVAVAEKCD